MHLPDEVPRTAYLRVHTESTMLAEMVNLWQPPGLLAATAQDAALHGLLLGMIALGALSYIVFWLWLREGVYRLYAFYLAALLLLNLVNSGYAAPILWPESPLVGDRAVGLLICLAMLAGLIFFDDAIGLRRHFPLLRRVIPVALLIYASGLAAAPFGYYPLFAPWVQLTALAMSLVIMATGPLLLRRGLQQLRLYVLAFAALLVVVVLALTRNLGFWPLALPINPFILGASALHVVLLNFALAERVRQTQRERLALEAAATRLEAEEQALGQQREFMSMVAHEFRTPLSIIDTSAQRIAGDAAADAAKTSERCGNIRAAVRRLTDLMDRAFRTTNCRVCSTNFSAAGKARPSRGRSWVCIWSIRRRSCTTDG